ncbi:transmembrane protein 39A-B [Rhipicephalus sanguineus]|uniref:Transmembrane protein 39A n=1 Tax=Rhipicephalus sanguineus TaxID=34632 RepID=A0A9D4PLM4_RHISA|nr:transmembrane protein 39A-B [Rhipicephalus sanguineus]KAH7946914.1 hypothetical protein HPB52_005907 [Rhipicephalus sanguineus]
MTRVTNSRRNFAKSGASKAVIPTDDRAGLNQEGPSSLARHIQLPELPVDGDLAFEAQAALFAVVLLVCQQLQLHRAAWWLPHAHQDQALHYELVEPHAAALSLAIMCHPLPAALAKRVLAALLPSSWEPRVTAVCQGATLMATAGLVAWAAFHVCCKHGVFSVLCLAYPGVIHVVLFGPRPGLIREWPTPVAHVCSSVPAEVRAEVERHKHDFNERLKRCLFQALLVTYYAALQPCCFVPPSLHLEPWALAQHGLLAWLAALTLHASRLFPPRYLDSLHRAALHLGRWRRLEARHVHAPHHLWSDTVLWPQNNLVKHSREFFRAEGVSNAAEPGHPWHGRFYGLFRSPAVVVGGALALQAAQLLFLLYVLASSSEWHRLLTASLLVLLNSLTLFKLARQYLVLDKVYHAERLLHERLAS